MKLVLLEEVILRGVIEAVEVILLRNLRLRGG